MRSPTIGLECIKVTYGGWNELVVGWQSGGYDCGIENDAVSAWRMIDGSDVVWTRSAGERGEWEPLQSEGDQLCLIYLVGSSPRGSFRIGVYSDQIQICFRTCPASRSTLGPHVEFCRHVRYSGINWRMRRTVARSASSLCTSPYSLVSLNRFGICLQVQSSFYFSLHCESPKQGEELTH